MDGTRASRSVDRVDHDRQRTATRATGRPLPPATWSPADEVHFPVIPANTYGGVSRPAVKFLALINPLHVLDFGEGYKPADASGILNGDVPKAGTARYGTLVPQVDEDGNESRRESEMLLRSGSDRHLHRMESLQQQVIRRWFLHTDREFHSVCIHDAGTARNWGPAKVSRRTLSEQGRVRRYDRE